MNPRDKLPDIGTTVFTVMSKRAAETGAVNLGQGFPDYPVDPRLVALVHEAMQQGHNQYAPMAGVPLLRERIAAKVLRHHGARVDPEAEITITLGATEALYSAIQALCGPGDEVIVFDPAYDSYDPAVRLAGARCIHVPLEAPRFHPDWDRVRRAFSDRTRLVVINSPQNPACSCLSAADLDALAGLVQRHDCAVLSDEVYEHLVYDGARHASVLAHPILRERSVAVYSFGKTLHATGLRIGYAVAPPALTTLLRKVHQYNTFTIPTAFQWAIAAYLGEQPACGDGLAAFFAAKRERLAAGLAGSGLEPLRPEGTYFMLLDYSRLAREGDVAMAGRLLEEAGVAELVRERRDEVPFPRDRPGHESAMVQAVIVPVHASGMHVEQRGEGFHRLQRQFADADHAPHAGLREKPARQAQGIDQVQDPGVRAAIGERASQRTNRRRLPQGGIQARGPQRLVRRQTEPGCDALVFHAAFEAAEPDLHDDDACAGDRRLQVRGRADPPVRRRETALRECVHARQRGLVAAMQHEMHGRQTRRSHGVDERDGER